jgi:hypothetical protein
MKLNSMFQIRGMRFWISERSLTFLHFIGPVLFEVCQFLVINILYFSSGSLKDRRQKSLVFL